MGLFSGLFSGNLKKLNEMVSKIEKLEPEIQKLSDEELKNKPKEKHWMTF